VSPGTTLRDLSNIVVAFDASLPQHGEAYMPACIFLDLTPLGQVLEAGLECTGAESCLAAAHGEASDAPAA